MAGDVPRVASKLRRARLMSGALPGWITIRGLRCDGRQGVAAERRAQSSEYLVDISCHSDLSRAVALDDLAAAVDIAAIAATVRRRRARRGTRARREAASRRPRRGGGVGRDRAHARQCGAWPFLRTYSAFSIARAKSTSRHARRRAACIACPSGSSSPATMSTREAGVARRRAGIASSRHAKARSWPVVAASLCGRCVPPIRIPCAALQRAIRPSTGRAGRHLRCCVTRSSTRRSASSLPANTRIRRVSDTRLVPIAPRKKPGFETLAIHAGQEPEGLYGAVTVPIFQTSTYAQEAVGKHKGYDYARTGNPTRTALEICLAALEDGKWGLAFGSGMAATDAIAHTLSAGDHVVLSDDVYGGTYRLYKRMYEQLGVALTPVDMRRLDAVRRAMRNSTKVVWIESPSNPTMKVVDIAALSEIAHKGKALAVVDNTFASPYLQNPLAHGADLVLHSTTKYIGGHSDVVGGAIAGNDPALRERLAYLQNAAGGVPGPLDAWLVLRGAKTLAVRMERHSANGQAVAEWLAEHPKVTRVNYPGLTSHPQHALARKQMRLFGGMLSFEVRGGEVAAKRLSGRTKIFALAESLGGVESLIEVPLAMTHGSVKGTKLAPPAGLVRLSVGIETVSDLIADLAQAIG
ncbi:MAG: cystathionine gamma-synthase [Chloroflexi bacterium]|nr:MAG: cystathionine gamma-synthase [Chloroflexota bacterium]